MSEKVLDFSKEKKFRIKTRKGDTVLREPVPDEYFKYVGKIKGVKEEDESDHKAMYDIYIKYLIGLNGEEEKLKSLTLFELLEVVALINGGDGEKK